MGKIESKSITVAPDEEQDIIAKYELFGWELKSTQEVLSRDSHLENRGDELYNVTTTQNYVKLMFQRDADSPVAAKARPVEDEYWRLYNRTQPIYFPKKNKLLNLVPLILCGFMLLVGVIGLFLPGHNFGEKMAYLAISIVFAAIFFGVSYAYRKFGYQRKVDAYLKNKARIEAIEEDMRAV